MAYVYGSGNDTLQAFQLSDTLVFGKAKVNSSSLNHNNGDFTFNMSDGGSIVIKEHWLGKINTVASVKDVEHLNIINNDKNKVKVKGTSGGDVIISTNWIDNAPSRGYSKVTINAGAGNDFTKTSGTKNSVDLGTGDDVAENWGSHTTINGGKGNDYIESYREDGEYSSLVGGEGNDSIVNHASCSTLIGGEGKDSIVNNDSRVSIDGGKGNDSISLNSTSNLIKYASGDGNDTITGFNSSDTLSISGGSYSTQASGNDIIVTVGKGNILLKDVKGNAVIINKKNVGSANKKLIVLTSGDDTLNNNLDSVTVSGGKGNDFIENDFGDKVSLNAGAGNDSIWNIAREEWNSETQSYDTLDNPDYATLDGGAGNDTIRNFGIKTTIDGGKGNDIIVNTGDDSATISGGKGNDEISLGIYSHGNVINYASGDGNDTILGFKATDTLSISGGSYSTQTNGYNVLVNVGSQTVALKNAYANADTIHINKKAINLKRKTVKLTADNNELDIVRDSVSVVGTSGNDYIGNGGSNVSINTGNGNDYIVNWRGSNVSISGGAGSDILRGGSGQSTLWGGADDDTLIGGAGKDIFVYKPGEGTDKIMNFDSGDMLKILKTNGKDGGSFDKATFSGGTLTLAISGGGNVIFENVSKGDKININSKTYTISGKTLK